MTWRNFENWFSFLMHFLIIQRLTVQHWKSFNIHEGEIHCIGKGTQINCVLLKSMAMKKKHLLSSHDLLIRSINIHQWSILVGHLFARFSKLLSLSRILGSNCCLLIITVIQCATCLSCYLKNYQRHVSWLHFFEFTIPFKDNTTPTQGEAQERHNNRSIYFNA